MQIVTIFRFFLISLFALAFVAVFANLGYKMWNRILRGRNRDLRSY